MPYKGKLRKYNKRQPYNKYIKKNLNYAHNNQQGLLTRIYPINKTRRVRFQKASETQYNMCIRRGKKNYNRGEPYANCIGIAERKDKKFTLCIYKNESEGYLKA